MEIAVEQFGTTAKGEVVNLYTLQNENGFRVVLSNYGAIIVSVFAKDINGNFDDIVSGFDTLAGYEKNPGFYGAVIGPYANRIRGAKITVDGIDYPLKVNENGKNTLHSDQELGIHKAVWTAKLKEAENAVEFRTWVRDMEMGFPGNKEITVTYTVTEDNSIRIHYHATSDKNTAINLTNHSYFNLDGNHAGKILDTELQILADQITPIDKECIPTGEFLDVTGTPFDFRSPKKIGQDIGAVDEQLAFGGGYDHNFVLQNQSGEVRLIARAVSHKSGRVMEVYTDQPGVQLYTGNFMENPMGKDGKGYGKREGFCLETQVYPNAINETAFPDPIYGPQKEYDTVTEYRFKEEA